MLEYAGGKLTCFVLLVPPTGTGWKPKWKENIQGIWDPVYFNVLHELI